MEAHLQGVPSNAAIAGHPLHPMLVVFPIAFLVAAFVTDLASRQSGDPFWARASLWLTGAGLVMGAVAAVVGAVDFLTIPRARVHNDGWIHALGNIAVLGLAFWSLLLRRREKSSVVSTPPMLLSATIAGLLVITGWYGGELSYRHMIGVVGHGAERLEQDKMGVSEGRTKPLAPSLKPESDARSGSEHRH